MWEHLVFRLCLVVFVVILLFLLINVRAFTEQSTSDVSVNKRQRSHSASAGPLSHADDIYCKFKLSFTIDVIQMELFTGDRDTVNFIVVIEHINAVAKVHS